MAYEQCRFLLIFMAQAMLTVDSMWRKYRMARTFAGLALPACLPSFQIQEAWLQAICRQVQLRSKVSLARKDERSLKPDIRELTACRRVQKLIEDNKS
jgi:hypothetical protein